MDPASKPLPTTSIPSYHISVDFKGEPLDKFKNNWKRWSKSLQIAAHINNLSRFLTDDPGRPENSDIENRQRWAGGDGALTALILNNIAEDEQDFVSFDRFAWQNYATLKRRHENQGVPHQISQLQAAFAAKCSPDIPLPKTAKDIRDKIRAAFQSSKVSEELLASICILNALDGDRYAHMRAIISHELATGDVRSNGERRYGWTQIVDYLESEQF